MTIREEETGLLIIINRFIVRNGIMTRKIDLSTFFIHFLWHFSFTR